MLCWIADLFLLVLERVFFRPHFWPYLTPYKGSVGLRDKTLDFFFWVVVGIETSHYPVLEELDIYGCLNHNVKVLRVLSKSLKKLSIQGHFSGSSLVIDAPRLGFLNIKANLFERFTITNTDTNVKLVIDPVLSFWDFDEANLYSNINRFCSFLSSISKVIRHMMLSGDTFKVYTMSIPVHFQSRKFFLTHVNFLSC